MVKQNGPSQSAPCLLLSVVGLLAKHWLPLIIQMEGYGLALVQETGFDADAACVCVCAHAVWTKTSSEPESLSLWAPFITLWDIPSSLSLFRPDPLTA